MILTDGGSSSSDRLHGIVEIGRAWHILLFLWERRLGEVSKHGVVSSWETCVFASFTLASSLKLLLVIKLLQNGGGAAEVSLASVVHI